MLTFRRTQGIALIIGMTVLATGLDADAGHRHRRGGSSGYASGGSSGHSGSSGGYGSGGSRGRHGSSGGHGSGGSSGGSSGGYGGSSGGYGGSSGGYGSGGSSGGWVSPPVVGAVTTAVNSTERAQLVLDVPADAKVYLVNQEMTLQGTTRKYSTPALERGKQYQIPIRVEVVRNGQTVQTTGQQIVQAGQSVRLVVKMDDSGQMQIASDVLTAGVTR